MSAKITSRFPGLRVDADRLEAFRASHPDVDRQGELLLCRACDEGDPTAQALFDQHFIAPLAVTDEVKQLTRQKLLGGRKLHDFSGRGALARWVKAVAARLSIDAVRGQREDAVETRVLEALLPSSGHPELEAMKNQARAALREAVHTALEGLEDRDRLFVQHYHLDGLTLTAIGELYGVAASTVMRSLDRSLEKIRQTAREHLAKTHGLGATSIDSLVRAAESHYES